MTNCSTSKFQAMIRGQRWTVRFVSFEWFKKEEPRLTARSSSRIAGLCDTRRRIIYLRDDLTVDEYQRTLAHELIHACFAPDDRASHGRIHWAATVVARTLRKHPRPPRQKARARA